MLHCKSVLLPFKFSDRMLKAPLHVRLSIMLLAKVTRNVRQKKGKMKKKKKKLDSDKRKIINI